jgi:hypothetical protein
VELLATSAGLPWRFEAVESAVKVHPGEFKSVTYRVVNTLDRPGRGARGDEHGARERDGLDREGRVLLLQRPVAGPGEAREMPVVFRVKAGLPQELSTISISYTVLREVEGLVIEAFKAVFWSFFGVRRRADYEADARRLRPQHVIAAGVVSALVFVLLLFGLVKWITR